MMDAAEWERVRREVAGCLQEIDWQDNTQRGDSPRSLTAAAVLAQLQTAKAMALVATILVELIEPPTAPGDPRVGQPTPTKKGDDRGPGYSVD